MSNERRWGRKGSIFRRVQSDVSYDYNDLWLTILFLVLQSFLMFRSSDYTFRSCNFYEFFSFFLRLLKCFSPFPLLIVFSSHCPMNFLFTSPKTLETQSSAPAWPTPQLPETFVLLSISEIMRGRKRCSIIAFGVFFFYQQNE